MPVLPLALRHDRDVQRLIRICETKQALVQDLSEEVHEWIPCIELAQITFGRNQVRGNDAKFTRGADVARMVIREVRLRVIEVRSCLGETKVGA